MEIDRKTLKALAADTRLDILKSLGKRRKTPSELSRELNLATSTVVEHLNKLEEADLIRKEETGHKWIYYNLTEKGSSLVKPKVPTHFVIVLSLCFVIVFVGFIYYYVNYMSLGAGTQMLTVPEKVTRSEETKMPEIPEIPETEEPLEIPPATAGAGNMTNTTNTTNSTDQTMT